MEHAHLSMHLLHPHPHTMCGYVIIKSCRKYSSIGREPPLHGRNPRFVTRPPIRSSPRPPWPELSQGRASGKGKTAALVPSRVPIKLRRRCFLGPKRKADRQVGLIFFSPLRFGYRRDLSVNFINPWRISLTFPKKKKKSN